METAPMFFFFSSIDTSCMVQGVYQDVILDELMKGLGRVTSNIIVSS